MSTNKKKKSKKAIKTSLEIAAERNRRYQVSDEYKTRRKSRYATDPEYRERCLANTKAQAERRLAPLAKEYESEVRNQIKRLSDIGTIREIGNKHQLTFTIIELSQLICRPAPAVRLWVNNGRFPEPIHKITKITGVYTEKQALAICEAMIKHLRTKSAHLTSERTDAILALHAAMR